MELLRRSTVSLGLKPLLRAVTVAIAIVVLLPFSLLIATDASAGSAKNGKSLFTGEVALANGGPACISCHIAGNTGALGGGTLGPDLTNLAGDGKTMLFMGGADSWVNSDGVPVMGAIFPGKKVTESELGDLVAFFESIDGQKASSGKTQFVIFGVAGTIGMLILFSIVWAGRYRSRNKGTAHDALWRNYGGKGGR
ncbi:MAG: hypothetical protein KAT46_00400 [Deltaproteobacteria bacterium]|nr:hypothetical protein [Deltaproteobacteria bacterium]